MVNSQRISIKNSFVHSFDDTVAVKDLDRYSHESNRDISVEHCVLWCDWGKACELGLKNAAREYTSITFRDCDVLRGGNTVCDIQNRDCAEIHHVLFEDIRMDLEPFYTPEILQKAEEQRYDGQNETAVTNLLSVKNSRFREHYAHLNLPDLESKLKPGDPRFAGVHHVTVKNLRIVCPESLVQRLGTKCASIRIVNTIPNTEYAEIRV